MQGSSESSSVLKYSKATAANSGSYLCEAAVNGKVINTDSAVVTVYGKCVYLHPNVGFINVVSSLHGKSDLIRENCHFSLRIYRIFEYLTYLLIFRI